MERKKNEKIMGKKKDGKVEKNSGKERGKIQKKRRKRKETT